MRSIILALAALAFATTAGAAPGAVSGPYKLDANGKCHDATGKFTKQSNCAPPAAPKHCRNPKTGKYVKCGTPGAVPA